MRTTMLLLPALLFGVACTDSSAPLRPVVGQWGGTEAAMTADPRQVRILAGCMAVVFESAIVPDAAGNFRLSNGKMQMFGAPPGPVTVRGHISGDAVTLTISEPAPGAQSPTYQLERDAPYAPTSYCMLA